jgi:hypothetical protein
MSTLTLSTAATTVGQRIHDTSTSTLPIIKEHLNEIMQLMISQRGDWEWLEAEGSFPTQIGVQEYTLDNGATGIGVSDLKAFLDDLRIEADEQLIEPMSVEEFTDRYPDKDSEDGTPRQYFTWADKLIIFPNPDAVATIDYRYYKTVANLTDNLSPAWPDYYNWVWLMGAEARMLDFRQDPMGIRRWQMFQRGMDTMVGDNEVLDEHIRVEPFSGKDVIMERTFPPHRYGPGF